MDVIPDKTTARDGRDARGRFTKGNTSNRAGGRKKGSVNRSLLMCREAAENLIPQLVELANDGNLDAIKLLMSYGVPHLKAASIPVETPETPEGIIKAMAAGEISTDVAQEAMSVHLAAARIEEISKLREEVEELKQAVEAMGVRL